MQIVTGKKSRPRLEVLAKTRGPPSKSEDRLSDLPKAVTQKAPLVDDQASSAAARGGLSADRRKRPCAEGDTQFCTRVDAHVAISTVSR